MNVLSKVLVDVREALLPVVVAVLRILRLDRLARMGASAAKTLLAPWPLWPSRYSTNRTLEDDKRELLDRPPPPRQQPEAEPRAADPSLSPCFVDEYGVPTYEAVGDCDWLPIGEVKFPGIDTSHDTETMRRHPHRPAATDDGVVRSMVKRIDAAAPKQVGVGGGSGLDTAPSGEELDGTTKSQPPADEDVDHLTEEAPSEAVLEDLAAAPYEQDVAPEAPRAVAELNRKPQDEPELALSDINGVDTAATGLKRKDLGGEETQWGDAAGLKRRKSVAENFAEAVASPSNTEESTEPFDGGELLRLHQKAGDMDEPTAEGASSCEAKELDAPRGIKPIEPCGPLITPLEESSGLAPALDGGNTAEEPAMLKQDNEVLGRDMQVGVRGYRTRQQLYSSSDAEDDGGGVASSPDAVAETLPVDGDARGEADETSPRAEIDSIEPSVPLFVRLEESSGLAQALSGAEMAEAPAMPKDEGGADRVVVEHDALAHGTGQHSRSSPGSPQDLGSTGGATGFAGAAASSSLEQGNVLLLEESSGLADAMGEQDGSAGRQRLTTVALLGEERQTDSVELAGDADATPWTAKDSLAQSRVVESVPSRSSGSGSEERPLLEESSGLAAATDRRATETVKAGRTGDHLPATDGAHDGDAIANAKPAKLTATRVQQHDREDAAASPIPIVAALLPYKMDQLLDHELSKSPRVAANLRSQDLPFLVDSFHAPQVHNVREASPASSPPATAFSKALRGRSTDAAASPLAPSIVADLMKPVQAIDELIGVSAAKAAAELSGRRLSGRCSNDTEDTESDRHLEEVDSDGMYGDDEDEEEEEEEEAKQHPLVVDGAARSVNTKLLQELEVVTERCAPTALAEEASWMSSSSSDGEADAWASEEDAAFRAVPPFLSKRAISMVHYAV